MRYKCAENARELDYEDVMKLTDNFNEERLITKFQFGRVYRGRIGDQELAVKVYDRYGAFQLIKECVLFDNWKFKGHPKLNSYCEDKKAPVMVIDLNPLDTLNNLIPKDNFSWPDRIKVALGFAETVRSLHRRSYPFKVRNIDAALIICDQEYTPILYDYSLITGGIFGPMGTFGGVPHGCYGYIDPYYAAEGKLTVKVDVFAFGVILLGLISKRVVNPEKDKESDFVNKWAEKEYRRQIKQGIKRPSLVDESLKSHRCYYPEDGRKLTWWAMECIKYRPDERPNMAKLVRILKCLGTIRNHGGEIGVKQMLQRL